MFSSQNRDHFWGDLTLISVCLSWSGVPWEGGGILNSSNELVLGRQAKSNTVESFTLWLSGDVQVFLCIKQTTMAICMKSVARWNTQKQEGSGKFCKYNQAEV